MLASNVDGWVSEIMEILFVLVQKAMNAGFPTEKKDVSFEVLRAVPWHTWQPRRQVLFNHPQIDVNLCCCAFNDSPLTAIPHRVRSTGDDDDSSSTTDGECKPLKTSHKNGTRM